MAVTLIVVYIKMRSIVLFLSSRRTVFDVDQDRHRTKRTRRVQYDNIIPIKYT